MGFADMMMRSLTQLFVTTTVVAIKGGMALAGAARQYHANKAMQYTPKWLHAAGQRELFNTLLATFEIRMPPRSAWDDEAAQHLVAHLGRMGDFVLELLGDHEGLKWRLSTWDDDPAILEAVEEAVAAYYPQAALELVPYQEDWNGQPRKRHIVPYAMAAVYPAPIYTADQIRDFDPLASIAAAMSSLGQGEHIRITTYLTAAPPQAAEVGHRKLTGSDLSWFSYLTIDGAIYEEVRRRTGYDRRNVYAPHLDRVMRGKLGEPLFHTLCLLEVEAPSQERVEQLVGRMLPHMAQYANPPFNSIEPMIAKDDILEIRDEGEYYKYLSLSFVMNILAGNLKQELWHSLLMVMSPSEIAALWHLPYEGLTASGIRWDKQLYTPLPRPLQELTAEQGVLVGECRWGRQSCPVYLPSENLTMHTIIAGKNGTGKSTLVYHAVRAQILSGRGAVVIDPKGTLVSALLQHGIPDWRMGDVVVLDISREVDGVWYPPPLNLLARDPSVDQEIAGRRLLDIMGSWYNEFASRQMADTMNMILLALAVLDNPTLADAIRLLEDETFRDDLISRLPDDEFVVRDFWIGYGLKPDKQREALAGPIRWRLRSFYNNKWLRAITCHPERLDLRRLVGENKILLVSLHDPLNRLPRSELYLLGAALISQLDMVVRGGAVTNAPYMLYVDEAQEFTGTDLPEMLSQVRQFGLGMMLANQYFRQLEGATFDAVEGNVATIVSFEMGGRDASTVATYMSPEVDKQELPRLGVHRAAVSLRYQGERQPAFVMQTLPPPDSDAGGRERELAMRRRSVERYTSRSYSEVTMWLQERYGQSQRVSANGDGDDEIFE